MGATKRVAEQIVQEIARDARAELRRGAVRQRARQPGQRGADVPAADPDRRAGDGDAPRDAPLLHDHPGGGAAGAAGGRDRARAARCSCSTWASRSRSLDLATDLIRLSGLEVGTDIEIRFTRHAAGREAVRGAVLRLGERAARPTTRRCCGPRTAPCRIGLSTVVDVLVDGARGGWSDDEIRELLVPAGPRLPLSGTRAKAGPRRADAASPAGASSVATTMIVIRTPSTWATVPRTRGQVARGSCCQSAWARRPPPRAAGCGTRSGEDRPPLDPCPLAVRLGDVRVALSPVCGVSAGRIHVPVEVLPGVVGHRPR